MCGQCVCMCVCLVRKPDCVSVCAVLCVCVCVCVCLLRNPDRVSVCADLCVFVNMCVCVCVWWGSLTVSVYVVLCVCVCVCVWWGSLTVSVYVVLCVCVCVCVWWGSLTVFLRFLCTGYTVGGILLLCQTQEVTQALRDCGRNKKNDTHQTGLLQETVSIWMIQEELRV